MNQGARKEGHIPIHVIYSCDTHIADIGVYSRDRNSSYIRSAQGGPHRDIPPPGVRLDTFIECELQ